MLSFVNLNNLASAVLPVYVMFQNTSEWLTANYLIMHKVLPTASRIYFHQKSTILVCILEDIVMPFPYAQTTFVNAALLPVVFSVFCDQCLCIVSPIVQHLRCHLFINKVISYMSYQTAVILSNSLPIYYYCYYY